MKKDSKIIFAVGQYKRSNDYCFVLGYERKMNNMKLKDLSTVLDAFANAYVCTEIQKSNGTELGFWWVDRHLYNRYEIYKDWKIDFITTKDDVASMVIYLNKFI